MTLGHLKEFPSFSRKIITRALTIPSQIQLSRTHVGKDFLQFSGKDAYLNRLCNDEKFKEAIDILCEQKRLREAVQLLDHIKKPSASIYSTLLQFCLRQRALEEGRRVHAHTKASYFRPGLYISNRLLDMYAKCGSLVEAQKVFDEMVEKDLCSWNTLISGYVKGGDFEKARSLFDKMPERDNFSWTAIISGCVLHNRPEEALDLYRLMQRHENSKSNKFTVSSALAASATVPNLHIGKEIHGHIIRMALDSDEVVWSALLDMYGKCGSIEDARHIFDKMAERDVVSWSTMIDRYFQDGRMEEGFALFRNFMNSEVKPNEFTFASILNACADLVAEDLGKQIHALMMRIGFNPSSFAASALVHMYSKCGNIENARNVFKWMLQPDLVSWTSLIVGHAQHGQHDEALLLFERLLKSGTQPDHVTFVGVLCACTHAGLVDKGLKYFYSIEAEHGLKHTADHYACIIDLLARAGRFVEVEKIINEMPMKPDKFLWASLLGGCKMHGNIHLAERAAEALFTIEPENPATYVTLANIYATAGKWVEVASVRRAMDNRKIIKVPGLSWIEIKRKVHVFKVGDKSHPKSNEILEHLGELSKKIKEEGYVPDTNFVLHDVELEQKEQNLSYHTEKLAISFGIISTPRGTTIKVFKNLRTCVDCHTAIKFISKITGRKIIVRDSTRFHCFEAGRCSCNNYW